MQPWIIATGVGVLVMLVMAASRTIRRFVWTSIVLLRARLLSIGRIEEEPVRPRSEDSGHIDPLPPARFEAGTPREADRSFQRA